MRNDGPPTRAEFQRLQADHERLQTAVELLLEETRVLRQDLRTQFQRTAEMQAILDEERRHDAVSEPNSVIRQRKRI